ncbi:MAG TPA: hypothetical protein VGO87_12730 [Acidimicrobiia bacterium]
MPSLPTSRRVFLRRSGMLAAAAVTGVASDLHLFLPAGADPAPSTAATSTPIGGEPWHGLTVLKVNGDDTWAGYMTRYCVSIVDVDPLAVTGDQWDWERDGRSRFSLRLEWASTNAQTNSRATTAWIQLRTPDGGGRIGSTEWKVPLGEAPDGVATTMVHLDTDPLNGSIDVPLPAGEVEIYLYVEKRAADGTISWSADSRGGFWGQFPKTTTYARGRLNVLSPGCMVGYHLGADPHGTCDNQWRPDGEACQTDVMGKRCAAVRIYSDGWEVPPTPVDRTINAGQLPMWSLKPPAGGWKAVAQDTTGNPWLTEIVDALRAYNREIIFIFHHEPHDDVDGSNNTDAWYRQAVIRIKNRLVERRAHVSAGGKVFFGYAPTLWDAKKGTPLGSNDRFYPGDGVFDLFCPTSYNWYNWNIGDGKWHSFEDVMWEAVALARARGQKLFPSETGCHPGADGFDRNQWLRDARTYMKTNNDARSVMAGFIYFHVRFMDAGQWHDWTLYNPDGQPGYQDGFAKDSFFTSTPFSLR